jgi:hypothetical protein
MSKNLRTVILGLTKDVRLIKARLYALWRGELSGNVQTYQQTVTRAAAFDVTIENNNDIILIEPADDYSVILPDIESVPTGFEFTLKNIFNDKAKGNLVPIQGQEIESVQSYVFYGKGFINLSKMFDEKLNTFTWVIKNASKVSDVDFLGKTKVKTFENVDSLTLVHNLGYKPISEVWVLFADGTYKDVNVDKTHIDESIIEIDFEEIVTGYILYS